GLRAPVLLVVNKIDKVKDHTRLLPFLSGLAAQYEFAEIIPVSARRDENLDELEKTIARKLPERPACFPGDQLTDRSERFLAAELIREKLTRRLGAELPYRISVTTDRFRETGTATHVHATIWVETSGQKAIVIGRNGSLLKAVGEQARRDMEAMFGRRINLRTWVKIKRGWTADDGALRQLGYDA
ncbi:MAG: GTPase Era, partial [Gammaproteobacteria bacterium]